MSPSLCSDGSRDFLVYRSGNSDNIGNSFNVAAALVVRPVLSLKSCVTVKSGNGTSNSPYEVELSNACASAIN